MHGKDDKMEVVEVVYADVLCPELLMGDSYACGSVHGWLICLWLCTSPYMLVALYTSLYYWWLIDILVALYIILYYWWLIDMLVALYTTLYFLYSFGSWYLVMWNKSCHYYIWLDHVDKKHRQVKHPSTAGLFSIRDNCTFHPTSCSVNVSVTHYIIEGFGYSLYNTEPFHHDFHIDS